MPLPITKTPSISDMSLKVQALSIFTVTQQEDQSIEIRQVDYLEFGPGGPNRKDVKMPLTPAISFGISTKGQIVGVLFRVAAMFMTICRLLQLL